MPDGFHDDRIPGPTAPERILVAALRAGRRNCQCILAQAGIRPAGVLGFELLLSVLTRAARRPLDVRQGEGAARSGDEAVLLELVAALQRGDALSALGGLSEWLEPDDLAPALRGAQIFARHAAAAGLVVQDAANPWPSGLATGRLAAPHRSG